ncbi:MAG TPA: 30S ribosomal protein S3 [Gammaproteobacteria bacterium]|nr:30S ribosomal protein S3 [Gammaproteobacteria bacterium]
MGHKVHPIGIRLGIIERHRSMWFANSKDYSKKLQGDIRTRDFLKKKLANAQVARIVIERLSNNGKITVYTARPGVVIGKKGEDIESLRQQASQLMGVPVNITIEEIRRPELEATLVAESIAQQLERRVMFRRAMKRAVTTALRLGAEGIKICVSGRLGGAEIARTEWYREGRVPLHTFRAHIDYAQARANTTYGVIGVKVWIFKGEIFDKKALEQNRGEGVSLQAEGQKG